MGRSLKKNSGPAKPKSRTALIRAKGEMIARHVVQLSEHLSTVQIVCTNVETDGTTTMFNYGSGDLYARAMASEKWLERVGANQCL